MHLVQVISVNTHGLRINLQKAQVLGAILIIFLPSADSYCMFCRLYLKFGQISAKYMYVLHLGFNEP
jgi:hypothetical protein